MPFQIGDRIVHPLHGAGEIDRIETRRINGQNRHYYVLKLPGNGMVVMVPVDGCEEIGVRAVMDRSSMEELFSRFSSLECSMTDNWNKRYRDNMLRIRSGEILDLAGVIKGLLQRDSQRGLSTGERRMLNQAKQILLSEASLSFECSFAEAEAMMAECMS